MFSLFSSVWFIKEAAPKKAALLMSDSLKKEKAKRKRGASSDLGLRLLGEGVIIVLTSFNQSAAIRALGLFLCFWYILCCTPRKVTCATEMKKTGEQWAVSLKPLPLGHHCVFNFTSNHLLSLCSHVRQTFGSHLSPFFGCWSPRTRRSNP